MCDILSAVACFQDLSGAPTANQVASKPDEIMVPCRYSPKLPCLYNNNLQKWHLIVQKRFLQSCMYPFDSVGLSHLVTIPILSTLPFQDTYLLLSIFHIFKNCLLSSLTSAQVQKATEMRDCFAEALGEDCPDTNLFADLNNFVDYNTMYCTEVSRK